MSNYTDNYRNRFRIIQIVFFIAAATLLIKALFLQVIDNTYRDKASSVAISKYVKYPSRGLIYDRQQRLLVNNEPIYDLMVTYNQLSPEMDTAYFCQLLGINKKAFEKRLSKNWRSKQYSKSVPFVFMSKIPVDLYAKFQESLYEFPGFFVQVRNMRKYPYKRGAHVLGYIQEVTPKQIKSSEGAYALGDYIGASGLELAYEQELKGKKGVNYLLKDNLGRVVDKYKDGALDSAAVSGTDIISSIDIELQQYGEELMANKTGSIVAIEPSTGEILAMVSSPSYDPNLLSLHRDRGNAFKQLLEDTLKPFFDRSVMAKYPPGSIFKTVISLVALQEEVILPNQYFDCNMGYYYNGRTYGCHDHPPLYGVVAALQHSCNSFYFQTFRRIIDKPGYTQPEIGLANLNSYLDRFGLGHSLGTDYPNEGKGFIPDPAYYDKLYPKSKGGWRSPFIMSLGIGQGEIQLTTLQMANLAAIMANRGYYYPPHLIKEFSNNLPIPKQYTTRKEVGIDAKHFIPVVEGMQRVVTAGTGWTANVPGLDICGKTGTSQNPHGKDHSVFFAFAPKDDPKIAIAVYVENGGWGTTYAAPIASLMIEKYLKGEISNPRQWVENNMKNANLIPKT